ncbi:MAG: hypothetical protein WBO10_09620 [Pyrinomonadaceae bacterium]
MANHLIKRAVLLGISLAISAVLTAAVSAQKNYSVPREVPLERVVRRAFPTYFVPRQQFSRLETSGFFPIGWSRDGKFAYYEEPVDEACGCYFANLVIQDLRTDKVIWKFDYNQDGQTDANGKMPPEDTIAKLWRKNVKLFSQKLRENGIIATNFAFLGKTFNSRARSYTAKAVTVMGKDDYDMERVMQLTVSLTSPKLGRKVLSTSEFKNETYGGPLDVGVVGVFKSPYENRVAVVTVHVQRGWEGPPHTTDINIVGADLVNGFGKGN